MATDGGGFYYNTARNVTDLWAARNGCDGARVDYDVSWADDATRCGGGCRVAGWSDPGLGGGVWGWLPRRGRDGPNRAGGGWVVFDSGPPKTTGNRCCASDEIECTRVLGCGGGADVVECIADENHYGGCLQTRNYQIAHRFFAEHGRRPSRHDDDESDDAATAADDGAASAAPTRAPSEAPTAVSLPAPTPTPALSAEWCALGTAKENICCGGDAECDGSCGGSGCGAHPGGAALCCAGTIRRAGVACAGPADVGCLIP